MKREKLIDSFNSLNDTDKLILEYYIEDITKEIPDMDFCYAYIKRRLDEFYNYYNVPSNKGKHPFVVVYDKLMDGAKDEVLIYHPEMYGKNYEKLAVRINELWNIDKYRNTILLIFRAFAERDWDELIEKLHDGAMIDEVQANIEDYAYTIVDNLDEEDLKAVILFCGGMV